jgi:type VI secretion system protein ImpC
MSRTSFGFQIGQPQPQPAREVSSDGPWRIVIVGDFTGRASRGLHQPEKLATRVLVGIDIDNFDSVLARLAPTVHVPMSTGGEGVAVTVGSLDEFHPDALFDRLDLFATLRASRRRLLNPATFADEAARLRPPAPPASASPAAPSSAAPSGSNSRAEPPPSNAELLSQILGEPAGGPPDAPAVPAIRVAGIDLARLVSEVVAPYVLPKADPRQAEYVAAVDEAAAELLRRILHARVFQSVESAWRQLWRVTKALTGEGDVRILLLDATRAELAADAAVGDPEKSGLHRLLVDQHVNQVDGAPWGIIAVLERFGRAADDCQLLASLGTVAAGAGGTLLADASPEIVGLNSWEQAGDSDDWRLDDAAAEQRWAELRSHPAASRIGLAAPRPLVRLPYGAANPAERIQFDELERDRRHDSYPWGYAALAVAELIGLAFRRTGWSFRLGEVNDVDDLPPCIEERDGEKLLLPGAEVFLSTSVGERLAARGVIPLLSYRNRHAARVMQFTALAQPAQRLAGCWS